MTTKKLGWAAGALALCLSGAAFADGGPMCRAWRLNGLYLFSATGYNIVPGAAEPSQPKAIVELIQFNGDGTLSVPGATRSVNGVIGRSPPGGTGIYALDADCRGTLSFTNGPSFDIYVAPGEQDLWMIQTNDNTVFQGTVTKISP